MNTPNSINIIPSIYFIEVTSFSNNTAIKGFCLNCLSTSKTNKQFKEYHSSPNISAVRICSSCHAMTIEAVIATFGISKAEIIALASKGIRYRLKDDTLTPLFVIDSLYLDILNKEMKNGEKRQRHTYGKY